MFGGCTINIQELDVPAFVYYGIEQMLKYNVRDEDVKTKAKREPPFDYVKAPLPFPEEFKSVNKKRRRMLRNGERGDKLGAFSQKNVE